MRSQSATAACQITTSVAVVRAMMRPTIVSAVCPNISVNALVRLSTTVPFPVAFGEERVEIGKMAVAGRLWPW